MIIQVSIQKVLITGADVYKFIYLFLSKKLKFKIVYLILIYMYINKQVK